MRKVLYSFSFSKFDTKKNYYSILGIHKTANQVEVKNQYHKLAKLYHPDINQDNLEKFKQINEAYEVLKDESIRKDYDSTQTQDGQYTKRSQYNQQYHYGYRRSESNKWQQNEQSYNFKYNHDDIYVRRQNGENPLKYGQVGFMVVVMTGIFAFMAVETLVSLLFKRSYIVQDEMGNSYELSEEEFEKLQRICQQECKRRLEDKDIIDQIRLVRFHMIDYYVFNFCIFTISVFIQRNTSRSRFNQKHSNQGLQYLIQSFVIGFRSDDSQQMIEWDKFFDHNNQNIFIGTLDCEIYFLSCDEETPFIEQKTEHGRIRHVGIFSFDQLEEFLIQDHDHEEDEMEEIIEIVVHQPVNINNNDWVQDDNENEHDHEHIEQHSEIQEKSQAEYLLELQQITSYVRDNYNRFKLEVSHLSNSINNIEGLMKQLSQEVDIDQSDIYLYLTIIFMLVYLILLRVWFKRHLKKDYNSYIQEKPVHHFENILDEDAPQIKLKLEDSRITGLSFGKHMLIEKFRFQLLFISLILCLVKYDDNFYPEYDSILIWIVTFTTFCLLILTYITYQTKLNYLKDACIIEPELPLSDSDLYGSFKFEFWLILIHPNYFCQEYKIYFNVQLNPNKLYYNLNDLLTLITIFRAIIVFRICLRFTEYYGSQVQRICNIYATEMDERFIMKNLVNNKPFSFVIFASLFGILYFTLAFWVAEFPLVRGNKHSLQLLFECFDDVYVIFCTFGANIFWKHNPQTFLARQILFINVIYAITIRSLFVSAVMSLIQLDDYEMKASSILDKLVVKEQIKEVSNEVNTLMARCMRYQINPFSVQRVKRIKILMAKINQLKRQYMSIDGESFSFLWKRKVKESTWKVEEMVEDFEKYRHQQNQIIKIIDDQQSDLKLQYMNWL